MRGFILSYNIVWETEMVPFIQIPRSIITVASVVSLTWCIFVVVCLIMSFYLFKLPLFVCLFVCFCYCFYLFVCFNHDCSVHNILFAAAAWKSCLLCEMLKQSKGRQNSSFQMCFITSRVYVFLSDHTCMCFIRSRGLICDFYSETLGSLPNVVQFSEY